MIINKLNEIDEIINRETKAWDTKDVELLLSIFHPDIVWFWPKKNDSHNPLDWESPLGKFNYERWKGIYLEMFSKYKLLKNDRKTVDIKMTKDGNGAFAVVDIDTTWEGEGGKKIH